MNNTGLEVKNLCKSFGTNKAIDDITINIEPGEILGLVGPNGAGKTTLIKLIVGLIHADYGSIRLFGKGRSELSYDELGDIGYVADIPNLYEFMSVREILKFNSGFFPNWDWVKCNEMISRFNLRENEKIKNFSRGMKAQLALILTLLQEPRLLVLDEPLEGLDPLRRIEFINMILDDFARDRGRSILISSHYLEELERIVDRIVFINKGKLVRSASVEQLKTDEKTIRVVFQKDPPDELLKMPGIRSVKREGSLAYLIAIENNFTEVYNACSKVPHFVLEVYHRNLEELFKEYMGGGIDDN